MVMPLTSEKEAYVNVGGSAKQKSEGIKDHRKTDLVLPVMSN